MVAMAIALLAAATAGSSTPRKDVAGSGAPPEAEEESPEVFLAKAALQQYLSRVVRKDWDGVRGLTHPKALSAIAEVRKRTGFDRHALAPWANPKDQLETFRFRGARQVGPGAVAIAVGEDFFHADQRGLSTDDPSVYLLFRSQGAFAVGDKRPGGDLSDVSDKAVRLGYRGYVDSQSVAQARRAQSLPRR
jgi:hypothetical protein